MKNRLHYQTGADTIARYSTGTIGGYINLEVEYSQAVNALSYGRMSHELEQELIRLGKIE